MAFRTLLLLGSTVLVAVSAARAEQQRSWLGVYLGDPLERGIAIVEVYDDGPAHRGGLRDGDVLVSLGGVAVSTSTDVMRFLESVTPGTEVEIEFARAGARTRGVVTVAARLERGTPRVSEDAYRSALWAYRRFTTLAGLTVVSIPEELRRHYEAPADTGVLVTGVDPDSVAAGIGLEVGDVVLRIGETPIRAPEDLRGARQSTGTGGSVTLGVVRKREALEIDLDLAAPRAPRSPYIGSGPGVATSVRTKLLQTELERLELRVQQIREQLERLKEAP